MMCHISKSWRWLLYVLGLLMVSTIGMLTVIAQVGVSPLQIKGYDGLSGVVYKIWFVTDQPFPLAQDEMIKLSNDLKDLSVADLDSRFPTSQLSPVSDENGNVTVSGLADGIYYIRDINQENSRYAPILLNFPFGENGMPQLVMTKQYPNTGGILLKKLGVENESDTDGKLLEGVTFHLFREGEQQPLRFTEMGQLTTDSQASQILKTDQQGQISLQGLQEGQYYFKELETLSGYQLLTRELAVEVSRDKVVEFVVKNIKDPHDPPTTQVPPPNKPSIPAKPNRPGLPSAGEIQMVATGLGAVLIIVAICGFLTSRYRTKQHHKESHQ